MSRRAPLVVHFCRLAARDRIQRRVGILHDALWVEIWEGTFHKLVGIHERLLFSEYPHRSATEGEKAPPPPHYSYSTKSLLFMSTLQIFIFWEKTALNGHAFYYRCSVSQSSLRL